MKKQTILFAAGLTLVSFQLSAQGIKGVLKQAEEKVTSVSGQNNPLSEEEVGNGLKEALTIGIEKGVGRVSKPDGFFKDMAIKILMPDEAKQVEQKLRNMGQGKLVDDAIESMNRAAEDAANGAKDIFVSAIKQMTITDAMTILKGDKDAATSYLNKTTRQSLFERFQPVIKTSLDKVGATKHWTTLFSIYNKLPMVSPVNPDLEEFVTNKAIDGLFIQIAKEEREIRDNPGARVSDLLKRVFG
jgi:hypothetical protein